MPMAPPPPTHICPTPGHQSQASQRTCRERRPAGSGEVGTWTQYTHHHVLRGSSSGTVSGHTTHKHNANQFTKEGTERDHIHSHTHSNYRYNTTTRGERGKEAAPGPAVRPLFPLLQRWAPRPPQRAIVVAQRLRGAVAQRAHITEVLREDLAAGGAGKGGGNSHARAGKECTGCAVHA